MANQSKVGEEPESPNYVFTPSEIKRFLDDKWKLAVCEICEAERSYTPINLDEMIVALPFSQANALTTVTDKAIAVLPVLCTSCGNTKLLAAPVIRDWLDRNL